MNKSIKTFVKELFSTKTTEGNSAKFKRLAKIYPFLSPADWDVVAELADRVFARTEGAVYSGPFAEMRLVRDSYLTSRPIWIVGCYEKELFEAINDLIVRPPSRILDIGSGYGYYTVGLATQIQSVEVIGFEADKSQWEEAKELAKLNHVESKISQQGLCTIDALREFVTENCAIISDCEGAEDDLLDPKKLPILSTCRIICEVHDFYRPGVTGRIVSRFGSSHKVMLISERPRDPHGYRILDGLTTEEKILSVTESKHVRSKRTAARYLWLLPK